MLRDWTDSLKFDGLSAEAERLFIRLIMKADDYGRFHAEPRLVKASTFPFAESLRVDSVSCWLTELSTHGLILRYEVGGREYLAIPDFGQRLKQSREKFPAMPGTPEKWLPTSGDVRQVPAASGNFPPLPGSSGKFRPEEKGSEVEGETEREVSLESEEKASPPPAAPPAPRPRPRAGGVPINPMTELKACINGLRAEWGKPAHWSSSEDHALFGGVSSQMAEMTDDDWKLLKAYLAASHRKEDGYWVPNNRSKFVDTFADVFSHAQRWGKKTGHAPAPKPPTGGSVWR